MKQVPEIGKYYHFWDDGKSSPSRHYICKVERIITPEEAKDVMLKVTTCDTEKNEEIFVETSLYDHWKNNELVACPWLYAPETDWFIEASCPKYDVYHLWFVRTKNGGWFSLNVESSWQAGELDVNGSKFEDIINECYENGWDISAYTNEEY